MPLSEAQLEKIRESARARKELSEKMGKNTPVVWIPDGTLHVRFYVDKEGEFVRTLWRHKAYVGKNEQVTLPCVGQERCPVCNELS